jgi:glycosyltransferase involved in cell wall biosynthesis
VSLEELQAYHENKDNSYVGIGITIQVREDNTGFDVLLVEPGSPALEAGIQPGDLLVQADGMSCSEMGLDGSRSNYAKKKALFTGIPNLRLTVPSFWLENRVKQSFLGEYPVEVVYNTINREIFKPTPGDFRKKHGLEGKTILLGVASVWDARKGLSDFVELAGMLDDTYKIVLIGLSQDQIAGLPANILGLPRTNSMEELVHAYSEADIFLNPSVEETFGMTAMEARCCGTEAIVYQDTACEEIVNQFGSIAVPKGANHLYAAVKKLTGEESQ